MDFIEFNLENTLSLVNKLDADTAPQWGSMSAQRVIEHLTDSLKMSTGKIRFELAIPEDKLPSMKRFLASDKPMMKNAVVNFAPADEPLRNEEIELAVDEFTDAWLDFDEYYAEHADAKNLHPYYGDLNHEEWIRLHTKHFTHHLQQFGLV